MVTADAGKTLVFMGDDASTARLGLQYLGEIAYNMTDEDEFHILVDGVDVYLRRSDLIGFKNFYDMDISPVSNGVV